MNVIDLIIGDYSGDSHDKKERYSIESNISLSALKRAYKRGTKKLGFDFIGSVAAEYEDNSLSENYVDILKSKGYDFTDIDTDSLEEDIYLDIFLFIIKLGNDSFKYKLKEESDDRWNIGGYGLFL